MTSELIVFRRSGEFISWVEDLAVTVGVVAGELTLNHSSVLESKFPESKPLVSRPVTLIAEIFEVFAPVSNFTVAVFLSSFKCSSVIGAIFPGAVSLTSNFALHEITFVARAVLHEQDAMTVLQAVKPFSLVLEVAVGVGVSASADSKLGLRVNITLIASLLFLEGVVFVLGLFCNLSSFIKSVGHFNYFNFR